MTTRRLDRVKSWSCDELNGSLSYGVLLFSKNVMRCFTVVLRSYLRVRCYFLWLSAFSCRLRFSVFRRSAGAPYSVTSLTTTWLVRGHVECRRWRSFVHTTQILIGFNGLVSWWIVVLVLNKVFCVIIYCFTMPQFCINTNVPRASVPANFVTELSSLVGKLAGKPEGVSFRFSLSKWIFSRSPAK